MRQTPPGFQLTATMALLMANVAAYILQLSLERFSSLPVDGYFALSLPGLRHGYVWQLLTYQFMHGGWLHLLVNCWAIYVFGREIEETFGRAKFLTLYFSSGVIGGLVQALAGVLLGGRFAAPVVGASAGAFGLIAAYAVLYPERSLMLLLFFIIPVSMRAKYLLWFSGLFALFGMVFPMDNIANAAHLGGMLTGIAFVRYSHLWHWPQFGTSRTPQPRRSVKVATLSSGILGRNTHREDEDLTAEKFLSKEVDPILDKISAHGIQSLTERERSILEAARTRMAKR